MKVLRYLEDVSTLELNGEKCTGCGSCIDVCPHGVFCIVGQKAFVADKGLCMECGACALNCPTKAIEVIAGVGCASAIIASWFSGKEPACECAEDGCKPGCC
ncbi:MAG: 4Fe-4S binding protein [Eubacteriaceae bacterium]|nr:4Fe-4S binding protein [Eubacteriaceae bacterium]